MPDAVYRLNLIRFRRPGVGSALRLRRRAMPAGRSTISFGMPEPIGPDPLAALDASVATPPAKPASTPRKRPAKPRRAAKPAPASMSFAVAAMVKQLTARLDAELAERAGICELCFDAVEAVQATRAELKAAPRGEKDDLRTELERAEYHRMRCGAKVIAIDARIARTRDEIKAAK